MQEKSLKNTSPDLIWGWVFNKLDYQGELWLLYIFKFND